MLHLNITTAQSLNNTNSHNTNNHFFPTTIGGSLAIGQLLQVNHLTELCLCVLSAKWKRKNKCSLAKCKSIARHRDAGAYGKKQSGYIAFSHFDAFWTSNSLSKQAHVTEQQGAAPGLRTAACDPQELDAGFTGSLLMLHECWITLHPDFLTFPWSQRAQADNPQEWRRSATQSELTLTELQRKRLHLLNPRSFQSKQLTRLLDLCLTEDRTATLTRVSFAGSAFGAAGNKCFSLLFAVS